MKRLFPFNILVKTQASHCKHTGMALLLIMHNVSGEGFNCFYRAIYNALVRSRFLAEIGCDTPSERHGVKCLRGKVAALVTTNHKARVIVKHLCDLAHSGFIESDTIMAEYANMYPDNYLTDTLSVTLERFAHIITTKKVMADSLDFEMMDNWLNKRDVSLFNVTYNNASSSKNLIKLLTSDSKPKQKFVILISTDNVHYNWVSFEYRTNATKYITDVVMNRELLLDLLATGDPQVERQDHSNAVSFAFSNSYSKSNSYSALPNSFNMSNSSNYAKFSSQVSQSKKQPSSTLA